MKLPIADALASKKFLAFLVTIAVVIGNKIVGHFGYELDPDQVGLLVGAAATYILAQGIADHGKSATLLNLQAQAMNDNAPIAAKVAQAGFISMHAMVVLLGLTAIGCAWFKGAATATAHDVVDCTTSTAMSHIKEYSPLVDAGLVYATGGDGHVDKAAVKSSAINLAIETGGCVFADAIARALKPAPADPNAPKSSPLVADPAELRATLAELYPGMHFKTPHGTL